MSLPESRRQLRLLLLVAGPILIVPAVMGIGAEWISIVLGL